MSRGFARTFEQLTWLAAAVLYACLNAHSAAAQTVPSTATLEAFRDDITGSFDGGGGGGNGGGRGGRKLKQGGGNLRTLVRLGFHDCVSATCDGCIDLNDPENNGLEQVVGTLEPICNTHNIGLADCWAAAASIAAEELGGAAITMLFGRTDGACGDFNGDPEGLFPPGEDGCDNTMNYMNQHFGFTQRETVAILGAHSLGEANPGNSGFDGPWTNNENSLDNAFYQDMLDDGWQPEQTQAGLWQWSRGNRLMLNSDMCLSKEVTFNAGGSGEPTCDFQSCGPSPTAGAVEEFAGDNGQWLTEFSAAMTKMLTKGYSDGELVQAGEEGGNVAVQPADTATPPVGGNVNNVQATFVEEDFTPTPTAVAPVDDGYDDDGDADEGDRGEGGEGGGRRGGN